MGLSKISMSPFDLSSSSNPNLIRKELEIWIDFQNLKLAKRELDLCSAYFSLMMSFQIEFGSETSLGYSEILNHLGLLLTLISF